MLIHLAGFTKFLQNEIYPRIKPEQYQNNIYTFENKYIALTWNYYETSFVDYEIWQYGSKNKGELLK